MERGVPLWIVMFLALVWIVLTVVFGWRVQTTLENGVDSGLSGRLAVAIARFPTLTGEVFDEFARLSDPGATYEKLRAHPGLTDRSGFAPVALAPEFAAASPAVALLVRRGTGKAAPGWRVLVGLFAGKDTVEHAALLLASDLSIRKVWRLFEPPDFDPAPRRKHRNFVHGFTVLPDGSVIFAFNTSVTLQRFDRCGNRIWATPGYFHHSITAADDARSVWTLRYIEPEARAGDDRQAPMTEADRNRIVQISVEDGSVIREFSMQDVIDTNPDTDVLELRRRHEEDSGGNSPRLAGRWLDDPFHLNDVDPLPAALSHQFSEFRRGDLLLSARSLNLVFVIDPETLKLRWWRVGATQRQHDPDWHPNGTISVYNNRMTRGWSEIVAIEPKTHRRRVVHDGRRTNFYSRIQGKHQNLPNGNLLITSPQQGRVMEIGPDGEMVLEFLNTDPATDGKAFLVSEAIWLPPGGLHVEDRECE